MPHQMEKVVAKGAGKLAAVKARGEGLRGVFTKLAEEHREALSLLNRMKTITDLEKRRELWAVIRNALLSHERAELREIYPAMMRYDAIADIVSRHALDAGRLETTLEELDALAFDEVRWEPEFEHLLSMLKRHIAEEEEEYFPRAQQVLGVEAAKRLEEAFVLAQEQELARLPR